MLKMPELSDEHRLGSSVSQSQKNKYTGLVIFIDICHSYGFADIFSPDIFTFPFQAVFSFVVSMTTCSL